jgi:pimeloyl-ACP methyl ester carboxylesterase
VPGQEQPFGPAPVIRGRAVKLLLRGEGNPVLLLHGNGSSGEEIIRFCPEIHGIKWIAPDRPGFGDSDAPPNGSWDPVSGADWTADLIALIAPQGVTLVAHSVAAGQALICAARRPDLVRALILLAPFCRPTPHRWMPLLRVASRPWIGIPIRYGAVPVIGKLFGRQLIARLLQSGTVPSWLNGLPVDRIVGGETMTSTATELLAFNAGMRSVERGLRVRVPTCTIWGDSDETAVRDWHLPWLRARLADLEYVSVPKAGHLVQHDAPVAVLAKIIEYSSRFFAEAAARRQDGDRQGQARPA